MNAEEVARGKLTRGEATFDEWLAAKHEHERAMLEGLLAVGVITPSQHAAAFSPASPFSPSSSSSRGPPLSAVSGGGGSGYDNGYDGDDWQSPVSITTSVFLFLLQHVLSPRAALRNMLTPRGTAGLHRPVLKRARATREGRRRAGGGAHRCPSISRAARHRGSPTPTRTMITRAAPRGQGAPSGGGVQRCSTWRLPRGVCWPMTTKEAATTTMLTSSLAAEAWVRRT